MIERVLPTKQFSGERADQVIRAISIFNIGKANFEGCRIKQSAVSASCTSTMLFEVTSSEPAGMALTA